MKRPLAVLAAALLVIGISAPGLAAGPGLSQGGGGRSHRGGGSQGGQGGRGHLHGGGGSHGGRRFHRFHRGARVFVAPWWPFWYYPSWDPYGPTCYTTPGQWVWDGFQWLWQPPETVCP
jgi:hypothetical protein